jgi:hypothetical protein
MGLVRQARSTLFGHAVHAGFDEKLCVLLLLLLIYGIDKIADNVVLWFLFLV